MKPFSEWGVQLKITAITGLLGFIVLLGQVLSTLPVLEPYFFASRGYARTIVDEAVKIQAAKADEYQKQVNQGLIDNTVGILGLEIIAYEGQMATLEAQLNTVILRLSDTPNDDLLKTLKSKIEDDIKMLQSKRDTAACERVRAQFDVKANTPC